MPSRSGDRPDLLNGPILMAAEMAYAQVAAFLQQLPAPLGRMAQEGSRRRFTLEDLRRQERGE